VAYAAVKTLARPIGLYRAARWFNRHFLNRKELVRELGDVTLFSRFVRPGDLVFDVGANWGEKCLVFLRMGARVVAIEPQEDCLDELFARCGRHSQLTTVKAAVAATEGTSRFFVRPHRGVSGLLEEWEEETEAEIMVSTVTLDQLIAAYGKPAFMKLDIEGFEYEALKGLTQPIPSISFEYHLRPSDVEKTRKCVDHLAGLGKIAINITEAEGHAFRYAEWLTVDQFRRVFPDHLLGQHSYRYGDVFVTTT
jgi:FkbM family methyltransferase